MKTQKTTLKELCKVILTKLKNQGLVECPVSSRQLIWDELFQLVHSMVLTDEDLKNQTLEKLGAETQYSPDTELTQTQQYFVAKSIVRKSYVHGELNGFYFKETPRDVAQKILDYFMCSPHVEEVYGTDDDFRKCILFVFKNFNPKHLH